MRAAWLAAALLCLLAPAVYSQADEEHEEIDSGSCSGCHEEAIASATGATALSHSVHAGLECLDCHQDRSTFPHQVDSGFSVGCQGCRACHVEASEEYQIHGRADSGSCEDIPQCKDCHGSHYVLSSNSKLSKTHPVNLPETCGECHENPEITAKYDILIDHPIRIYSDSVHGQATKGGVYVAATCNDCHSTAGTAHKIYSPGHPESSINHFNVPATCGKCHKGVEADFWEGIHGKLVARGETDAPVCTHCHGEHGITASDDPDSPVSSARIAEQTCSPCHESAVLNEKYGMLRGRLTSFIDSYHGLKAKAGDTHVANCASCHGVHRILPSSDPTSTVHPSNLQSMCGECHPGISEKMALQPIHGVSGEGLRTPAADVVEKIYIVAIVAIIGLMLLHWAIEIARQIKLVMRRTPQILRMTLNEVWQHLLLMITFIVLVISGFALRFSHSWLSKFFFGWEGGFEWRGAVHRTAAVLFFAAVGWHAFYLVVSRRGRTVLKDMMPTRIDLVQFWQRILFNLGWRSSRPQYGRFNYVEKAEYWALVWGSVVMIISGLLLWFDNWFIQFLPKGVLDVALVIHYYEAWLATLAILVWHLYSAIFSPHVYPMNPSWLTGKMPDDMYRHEHPEHYEAARMETEAHVRQQLRIFSDDRAPKK